MFLKKVFTASLPSLLILKSLKFRVRVRKIFVFLWRPAANFL